MHITGVCAPRTPIQLTKMIAIIVLSLTIWRLKFGGVAWIVTVERLQVLLDDLLVFKVNTVTSLKIFLENSYECSEELTSVLHLITL